MAIKRRSLPRLSGLFPMCLLVAPLFAAQVFAADQPLQNFPALVQQLDAPDFDARESASRQLAELAQCEDLRKPLAAAIERALLSTELSFEARSRLLPLAKSLPAPQSAAPTGATVEQIESLLDELAADDAGIRAGAAASLKSLVVAPQASPLVMLAVKSRLGNSQLDSTTRRTLRELLDQARGVWLTSDSAGWKLPAVGPEQIETWIATLVQRPPDGVLRTSAQEVAERELIDLLAREEYADHVRDRLAARLQQPGLDVDATSRLEAVYDWTKPAMVAEFWQGYQHISIQHLLVDVPSVPEGGVRASHFDRIDDQFAHCVSGNTLSPGDHPVGVFFPHPQQGGAQFHLVNLPTTRQRLAYEYTVQARDDVTRGREILGRTLDRLLAQRTPLSNSTILMLEELDDGRVSAFTGPYLMKVDDSHYPPGEAQFIGNLSRHQNLCHMLARSGRREAVPGLLEAIKADRFLEASRETPFVWQWVAVLCIAVHDPWDDVDEFLAGLIERTDPLMKLPTPAEQAGPTQLPDALDDESAPLEEMTVAKAPEVGATAAAILLSRHGIPPTIFGLELLSYSPLLSLDCPGSHFRDSQDRQRVLEWWQKQKAEQHPRAAAG
jgi:hypothetical protein